ncbi:MAG: response regulator transcription factor [Cyanobacteria bacterium P01_E01_bin.34]
MLNRNQYGYDVHTRNLSLSSGVMNATDSTTIRVLIADEQGLAQPMLKAYLNNDPSIQLVGSNGESQSTIAQIQMHKPDVTILDIERLGNDGLIAVQAIAHHCPETKVLILNSRNDSVLLNKALQLGVKGYLDRATPPSELIDAIHYIHKGYLQLGPGLIEQMLSNRSVEASQPPVRRTSLQPIRSESPDDEPEQSPPELGERDQMTQKLFKARVEDSQQGSSAIERIKRLERAVMNLWVTLAVLASIGFAIVLATS